jgi:hypothetical protein
MFLNDSELVPFCTKSLSSFPVFLATFSVPPQTDLVFDIYKKPQAALQKSIVVGQLDGVNLVGSPDPSPATYLVARRVGNRLILHKATPTFIRPEVQKIDNTNLIKKDANARTVLGQAFGTRKKRNIIRYQLI